MEMGSTGEMPEGRLGPRAGGGAGTIDSLILARARGATPARERAQKAGHWLEAAVAKRSTVGCMPRASQIMRKVSLAREYSGRDPRLRRVIASETGIHPSVREHHVSSRRRSNSRTRAQSSRSSSRTSRDAEHQRSVKALAT